MLHKLRETGWRHSQFYCLGREAHTIKRILLTFPKPDGPGRYNGADFQSAGGDLHVAWVDGSTVASKSALRTSCTRVTCTVLSLPSVVCQTSAELKALLEKAFTAQKEALVAHWGGNADEEGKIDRYFYIRYTVTRTHHDDSASTKTAASSDSLIVSRLEVNCTTGLFFSLLFARPSGRSSMKALAQHPVVPCVRRHRSM